jgi:type II secretion system protein H
MMSRAPTRSNLRRAFTLLELLLVLMLMGISAATIVPHLNGTLDRWQLRETARNIQTTLQVASQWACVRQETVVFALDAKRNAFSLRLLNAQQSSTRSLLPVGRQSCGQGVEIVRTEGFEDLVGERVLVFQPDGTSRAGRIVLTGDGPNGNRETLWEITVDGHGTVRCREGLTDEVGK